ncbi:MAG: site-specific integrase [Bacteroidota bacterium]
MSINIYKRPLKSGATALYLDIRHNGKRWRESLKIIIYKGDENRGEKMQLARDVRTMKEMQLLKGEIDQIPDDIKNISFKDFQESFLEKYPYEDSRIIKASVLKFLSFSKNKPLRVRDITPIMMRDFMYYLNHYAGLSGETAHNYWTRFKKLLKDAELRGILNKMPTDEIRFKNPNKNDTLKKSVLTAKELQVLANTPCGNQEVKRAFLLSCFTSLGLAEIRDLKWTDVKNGRLVCHRKKTGQRINNRLSATALNIIGEPDGPFPYVFRLRKISTNAVNKNIKLWCSKAGIDKSITFYCGRHSFACLLLMNGANLKTVADAMGHRSTKSTLKYLNHVQKLQDEAIDNLPLIEL